jgi:hypothetical protein
LFIGVGLLRRTILMWCDSRLTIPQVANILVGEDGWLVIEMPCASFAGCEFN